MVVDPGGIEMTSLTITAGTTRTARLDMNDAGVNDLTVEATAAISVSANAQAVRFTGATANGTIVNDGTIEDVASGGRAIRIESGVGASFTAAITNHAAGTIHGDDDALQVQSAVTSGTITLTNDGIISSAVGQAVDFAAVDGATVIIGNTGTIQADTNDGVRTGNGATVTNTGAIKGGAAPGFTASADGVDFRAFGGTLHNDGGTIEGDRHGVNAGDNGVAGEITVTNALGATIIGHNGSGVGSDGTGSVTNYGTITGAFSNSPGSDENSAGAGDTPDGQPDGDGDGVDFDFAVTVENYGTIQGTGAGGHGSDGLANTSEGIAAGGGAITNHSGAAISGVGIGILVDDSSQGNAPALTTIVNDGTITGSTLFGIKLVSAFADTVENNGTISGGNGTAILFGEGDNTLTVGSASIIIGISDGGLGHNTLEYQDWLTGVQASLARGVATGTGGIANFQDLVGSDGADYLVGSAAANSLSGGDGNDRLVGGLGDTLDGGAGQDTLTVDGAAVMIDGGAGTDTLIVDGTVALGAGLTGIERVVVSNGAHADFSAVTDGLVIASRSIGGGGSEIVGTAGDDRISARLGDDILHGGAGDDLLIGGGGSDSFNFDAAGFGRDTIARFTDGVDHIALDGALASGFDSLDIIDQHSRTVVDFGNGDLIILRGVAANTVDASDFLFVS